MYSNRFFQIFATVKHGTIDPWVKIANVAGLPSSIEKLDISLFICSLHKTYAGVFVILTHSILKFI